MGPDAIAVFLGAKLATRSNDTDYRFRQDSDFWYLTGLRTTPTPVAVLRTDGGPEYTLYVQPRRLRRTETWTGYRPGVEGAVRRLRRRRSLRDRTANSQQHLGPMLIGRAKRFYHVLGRDTAVDAKITETLEGMRLRSPRASCPRMRSSTRAPSFTRCGRRSSRPRSTSCGAPPRSRARPTQSAAKLARDGTYEYELEAAIEYVFRRRGARRPRLYHDRRRGKQRDRPPLHRQRPAAARRRARIDRRRQRARRLRLGRDADLPRRRALRRRTPCGVRGGPRRAGGRPRSLQARLHAGGHPRRGRSSASSRGSST